MPPKIQRTPSEEARHKEVLKTRKQERDRTQRLNKKQKKGTSHENTRKRVSRANMNDEEIEVENAEKRARMQLLRQNLTQEERLVNSQNAKSGMRSMRRPTNLICAGGKDIIDTTTPHFLGPMNINCEHCSANHFENEKVSNKGSSFSSCCQHGSIKFPTQPTFPDEIKKLFDIQEFQKNIRLYNNIHAFASFNAWGNSTVMIMANPEDGPISDFNMIVGALDNIQIIGIIEQLPEQDGDIFIMVIRDPLGNFAEITLHDGLDVIIGETWVFHGNVKIQDGVIMVEANHAHLEA